MSGEQAPAGSIKELFMVYTPAKPLRIIRTPGLPCPSWCTHCGIDPDEGGGWHQALIPLEGGDNLKVSQGVWLSNDENRDIEIYATTVDIDYHEVAAADARQLADGLVRAAELMERIDAENAKP